MKAIARLILTIARSGLIPERHRWRLFSAAGVDVEPCVIGPQVYLGGTDVSIGAGSFVNRECFIDNSGPVRIGREVFIGMRALICTSSHEIGYPRRAGHGFGSAVTIGDHAWIGAGATILPGLTVGERCVIAAGAVVRQDCDADGLYAGVPARRVRTLPKHPTNPATATDSK